MRSDQPSCAARGSEVIAEALEKGVAERRIAVTVKRSVCMSKCTEGPTLRLAPGGRFIQGPALADVPDILDQLEAECGIADDSDAALDSFPGT